MRLKVLLLKERYKTTMNTKNRNNNLTCTLLANLFRLFRIHLCFSLTNFHLQVS